MHAAFVFRRDLRLDDDTGFHAALDACERVATILILDPRQAGPFADACLQEFAFALMVESLDLERRGGRIAIQLGEASIAPQLARSFRVPGAPEALYA